MSVRKVLIVGGGIGGLTSAVALERQGIEADVVEVNPAWSVYGVGIIQPSNMLRALAQIDLARLCVQLGGGFPGWRVHDVRGNRLVDLPSENVAGAGYPPVNGITRPLLHKVLQEATLAQGTRVRVGVTVDTWDDRRDAVEVGFTDGSSGQYDAVICSDGVHSRMRSRLFGDSVRPISNGESVWRYNLPRPRDMAWGEMYFGNRSKAGLVPLSPTLMYIFLVTLEAGNPRMPAAELHTLLLQRLEEYGGRIAGLRQYIVDPRAVVYRPMETVLVPPPWNRGRIILIGDAVHAGTPHLAQGAAMAIEDAVLLAETLATAEDVPASFTAFASRRTPRCKLMVDVGLQLGEWEKAEWLGRPDPATDHGGLLHRTTTALMEPA